MPDRNPTMSSCVLLFLEAVLVLAPPLLLLTASLLHLLSMVFIVSTATANSPVSEVLQSFQSLASLLMLASMLLLPTDKALCTTAVLTKVLPFFSRNPDKIDTVHISIVYNTAIKSMSDIYSFLL